MGRADVALDLLRAPFRGGDIRQFVADLEERCAQPLSGKQFEDAQLHAREAADVHERAFVGQHRLVEFELPIEVVVDVSAP